MAQSYPTVIGKVSDAHYYEDLKAIRAIVDLPDGQHVRVEIPITTFSFHSGMDKDAEMRKTATLMLGKNIKIVSIAES